MLIFSDYDSSFYKIEEMIRSLNIKYGKVMGSMPKLIKQFLNIKVLQKIVLVYCRSTHNIVPTVLIQKIVVILCFIII